MTSITITVPSNANISIVAEDQSPRDEPGLRDRVLADLESLEKKMGLLESNSKKIRHTVDLLKQVFERMEANERREQPETAAEVKEISGEFKKVSEELGALRGFHALPAPLPESPAE